MTPPGHPSADGVGGNAACSKPRGGLDARRLLEAIACFLKTKMDVRALGNFVVERS